MRFLLFVLSILIGAFGVFVLFAVRGEGVTGGLFLVLSGVLLSGAAIVDAINRLERVMRNQ